MSIQNFNIKGTVSTVNNRLLFNTVGDNKISGKQKPGIRIHTGSYANFKLGLGLAQKIMINGKEYVVNKNSLAKWESRNGTNLANLAVKEVVVDPKAVQQAAREESVSTLIGASEAEFQLGLTLRKEKVLNKFRGAVQRVIQQNEKEKVLNKFRGAVQRVIQQNVQKAARKDRFETAKSDLAARKDRFETAKSDLAPKIEAMINMRNAVETILSIHDAFEKTENKRLKGLQIVPYTPASPASNEEAVSIAIPQNEEAVSIAIPQSGSPRKLLNRQAEATRLLLDKLIANKIVITEADLKANTPTVANRPNLSKGNAADKKLVDAFQGSAQKLLETSAERSASTTAYEDLFGNLQAEILKTIEDRTVADDKVDLAGMKDFCEPTLSFVEEYLEEITAIYGNHAPLLAARTNDLFNTRLLPRARGLDSKRNEDVRNAELLAMYAGYDMLSDQVAPSTTSAKPSKRTIARQKQLLAKKAGLENLSALASDSMKKARTTIGSAASKAASVAPSGKTVFKLATVGLLALGAYELAQHGMAPSPYQDGNGLCTFNNKTGTWDEEPMTTNAQYYANSAYDTAGNLASRASAGATSAAETAQILAGNAGEFIRSNAPSMTSIRDLGGSVVSLAQSAGSFVAGMMPSFEMPAAAPLPLVNGPVTAPGDASGFAGAPNMPWNPNNIMERAIIGTAKNIARGYIQG